MAALASRRERRAAWRALRAFLPGSALDTRFKCMDDVLFADYSESFARRWHDPARPKHAARTAQWRAMWTDPKAGYLAGSGVVPYPTWDVAARKRQARP